MTRHYVNVADKALPYAQRYISNLRVEDWKAHLVGLLAPKGTTHLEHLPPNGEGPRVAIHCGKICFELGFERTREDALYLFHVSTTPPRGDVRRLTPIEFVELPAGYPEALDVVEGLFGTAREATNAESVDSEPPPTQASLQPVKTQSRDQAIRPSSRLCAALGLLDGRILSELRPQATARPPTQDDVGGLRAFWQRYQFRRHSSLVLEVRHRLILDGQLQNPEDSELDGLFHSLGIPLLNAWLAEKDSDLVQRAISDLAALPINELVRAQLWAHALLRRDYAALVRELTGSSDVLSSLAVQPERGLIWSGALISARSSLEGDLDARLDMLFAAPDADTELLAGIADWIGSLRMSPSIAPAEAKETTDQPHVPSSSDALDKWLFSLYGLSGSLERLRNSARESATELMAHPFPHTVAQLCSFRDAIGAALIGLQRVADEIPDAHLLRSSRRSIEDEYERVKSMEGDSIAELVRAAQLPPESIQEVASLLRDEKPMRRLPDWAWRNAEGLPLVDDAGSGMVRALADPGLRSRISALISIIKQFPDVSDRDLSECPPPNSQAEPSPETHLAEHLTLIGGLRELTEKLPPKVTSSIVGLGPHEALAYLTSVQEAARLLGADAFEKLVAELSNLDDQPAQADLIAEIRRGIAGVSRQVGSFIENLPLEAIKHWLTQHPRATADSSALPIRIENNFTNKEGRRAVLRLAPIPEFPRLPFGTALAPMLLTTDSPRDYHVKLQVVPKPNLLGFPYHIETAPRPMPEEINVSASEWRSHPEAQGRYCFSFKLSFQAPRDATSAKVALTCRDGDTDMQLAAPRDYVWDIDTVRGTPTLNWREGINTDFVRKHPIGVQTSVQALQAKIRQSSSFGVTAPRRFGKTTLARYLHEFAVQEDWLCPAPVVCHHYLTPSGVDAAALWGAIAADLERESTIAVVRDLHNGLPTANAFHHLRQHVKRVGKRGIVLILDEAQSLFPRGGAGYEVGRALKALLERSWSHETEELCPVVVGLIGLPGLMHRAGMDFVGTLRPLAADRLKEPDLNRLLLDVTAGSLQTTKEARQLICQSAPNLMVLKELVERATSKVFSERRTWINHDDVVSVVRELVDGLGRGDEVATGGLIRDVFNDSENVDEFIPRPEFPVAAALARSRRVGGVRTEGELVAKATAILREWAAAADDGGVQQLVFQEDRVSEHLEALREAGIVREIHFASEMVEAWLVGRTRYGFPADPQYIRSLANAAFRRVRVPRVLEPAGQGGEATVYRFQDESGELLAWREVRLDAEADQIRFAESATTLLGLRDLMVRREAGSEFVFELKLIGLKKDDERCGVQVYRWIDGEDLSVLTMKAPPGFVARVGHCLASALAWLHSKNVLHRDIRPRNVIWSASQARPVLVDFGLARLEQRDLVTAVSSEFSAPEVRGITPRWSKAADVWSLARLLRELVDPHAEGADRVLDALVQASDDDPKNRPSASELRATLDALLSRLHVAEQVAAAWSELEAAVQGDDGSPRWINDMMSKFRPRFEAILVGYSEVTFVAVEVADFLNQVLERCAQERGHKTGGGLGAAKHEHTGVWGGDLATGEVEFLHALRTGGAHGTRDIARTIRKFGPLSSDDVRSMVISGTDQISAAVRLAGLSGLVRRLFQASKLSRPLAA